MTFYVKIPIFIKTQGFLKPFQGEHFQGPWFCLYTWRRKMMISSWTSKVCTFISFFDVRPCWPTFHRLFSRHRHHSVWHHFLLFTRTEIWKWKSLFESVPVCTIASQIILLGVSRQLPPAISGLLPGSSVVPTLHRLISSQTSNPILFQTNLNFMWSTVVVDESWQFSVTGSAALKLNTLHVGARS